ncbi:DinB/UmuC family translesion DNA polymerase [Bacillus pseudomycoides]|uniref:DinB/UmuC family translesion DNA polymerase n=1 Tax=Bacillus pseudomycoides TaxID=64104 RepID=UPI003FA1CEB3
MANSYQNNVFLELFSFKISHASCSSNHFSYILISFKKLCNRTSTSITKGQILLEDCFSLNKLKLLLLEQIEETCFRLRSMDKCCRTVELAIGYSKYIGGGFKRAITLDQPTCLTEEVYEACLQLLKKFHSGHPVRQIHITLKNLTRDDAIQMSLFDDTSRKDAQRKLAKTMDGIRHKFGKKSIMRGVSFIKGTTQRERNGKIAGYKA